jgi:hypothetical protein
MPEAAPKIFISWSGDYAENVAGLVRDWLTSAYQRIDVFFSPDSIEKGARPLSRIEAELASCVAAIVVVTADSMKSAWVNYEVGALSSLPLSDGRPRLVIPLLVGVDRPADVIGPLTQFQAVLMNMQDFRRMIGSLNGVLSMEASWVDRIVTTTKTQIEAILKSATVPADQKSPQRPDRELLEEILQHVRNISGVDPLTYLPYDGTETGRLRRMYGPLIEGYVAPWDYELNMESDGNLIVVLSDSTPDETARAIEEHLDPIVEAKVYVGGRRLQAPERREGTSTI